MNLCVIAKRGFAALLSLILASGAWAAGEHKGGHGHGGHGADHAAEIGKPGKATAATRTIRVHMYDNHYEPASLAIKEGETVRFIIENKGEFVHEFNIATAAMHKAHAPEMQMMVEHGVLEPDRINWDAARKMQATMGHGMHNEPNSALLEPGKSAEIVWTFPKHATLEFACNVPGHYGAGMVGKIKLTH
jgi:uncharacterized cupredoxin-like copper-binding protein